MSGSSFGLPRWITVTPLIVARPQAQAKACGNCAHFEAKTQHCRQWQGDTMAEELCNFWTAPRPWSRQVSRIDPDLIRARNLQRREQGTAIDQAQLRKDMQEGLDVT